MAKSRWQEKREASFETLVSSAMSAFGERGYAAARVADIVAGTGYTSGTFYFHFKDKKDCFWHVLELRERLRGDWSDFVIELDPKTTDLEAVVRQGLTALAASERTPGWALVMVDFFQQHRGDVEVAERLEKVYGRWHEEVSRFVLRIQEGGWVDRRLDPMELTTQLFGFVQGLTVHAALYRLAPEACREAVVSGIVRLLGGQQSGRRR